MFYHHLLRAVSDRFHLKEVKNTQTKLCPIDATMQGLCICFKAWIGMDVTGAISETSHKQNEASQKKMLLWKRRLVDYFKRPMKSYLRHLLQGKTTTIFM